MDKISTFLDILQYRAIHQSEQIAYTFLINGETESVSLTYKELERKAQAIAIRLLDLVKVPGSRVLLLFPPGLNFITAFFGCLYAGCVAVPAYPPRRNQKLSRLQAIVSDAQASMALTTTSELTSMESQLVQNPKLCAIHWLAIDKISSDCGSHWQDPTPSRDTLAFLQYTSGSTGMPKGVMVTHGNLLHNEQIIQRGFGHTHNSITVGWLPLFHDMGLVGNVLQPLYLGIPCFLMSPVAFLQKPIRWLQAISRYKATTSGGPNFAYELCVRQITSEQRDQLDLSSWEVAFSGAEPIRAETLERFTSTFADYGFRHEAFYPCYGMAETTLFVSGGLKKQPPVICQIERTALEKNKVIVATDTRSDIQKIVGCGRSWLDTKIAIVEPKSLTRLTDGQVGEIWVSSPSVASGYWNRPSQTKDTFRAYLDTDEEPYLRTGDLGFLQDGELFVTGRLKDLIIILGRNHYPQDIELTVEQSHLVLRPSCGAVFSVEIADVEQLVIVQEVERTHLRKLNGNDAITAIRKAVAEQHDLQAHTILLLKTGTLPKTSSGKVQRSACREGFLAGNFDVVADWSVNPKYYKNNFRYLKSEVESIQQKLQTDNLLANSLDSANVRLPALNDRLASQYVEVIEAWLLAKIAEHIQILPAEINIRKPLSEYGLNSLAAVRISGELQEWLGREFSPTLLYDYPTLESLAQHLADETSASEGFTPQKIKTESGKETEEVASKRLEIDLPQAFIVAGSLNTAFWRTQQFMLAITPELDPKAPQIAFPFDPSQPGNAQVKILNLGLNDQKRHRQIPVDIYWSTAATANKPVIVLSHGFASVRMDLRYLAEHLASHGYVVAALEHPGSNQANTNSALQGKTRVMKPHEFLDRPEDISFVLDELEKLNQTPNHPLQGKLATTNAMVIGHCFGGATALEIAGAELQLEHLKQRCKENLTSFSQGEVMQCIAQELPENSYQLRDTRIKQAIALNPTTSLMFGETGLSKVQIPTLVLASSADKITLALTEQIVGFDKMPSPKWLVGIVGGTHLSVKDPSTTLDQIGKPNTPISGGEVVGEQAADIRNYVKAIALAFAAQMTPEAKNYAIFLTSDYAQFASTAAFPFRLIRQIPPDARAVVKEFVEK